MRGEIYLKNRNKQVQDYIGNTFAQEDLWIKEAREYSKASGLPQIAVPKKLGMLLTFFTRMQNPKRILEIGTLAAYSTLWLAKGAPKADITTIECNPLFAKVAKENIKRCPTRDKITVVEGYASQVLPVLKPSFDLIFLDADKADYTDYLPELLRLSRPGTLLLIDNLIPKKGTLDPHNPTNTGAKQTFAFNEILAAHPSIETILTPTIVGRKGRIDALGISIIK
ncbi:MAG TPA: O-methyltransferase [Chlamydiales bacterium]|nr:O-methyltransferase [Chlamydiales bacterium]HPE85470.1 O-methyltransferase [Chlamydiales bacterium]